MCSSIVFGWPTCYCLKTEAHVVVCTCKDHETSQAKYVISQTWLV